MSARPTSRRAMWKPAGNDGVPDAEITIRALSLTEIGVLGDDLVSGWTQEQRDAAYDWAMRVHFRASDNSHVRVPPRPEFLTSVTYDRRNHQPRARRADPHDNRGRARQGEGGAGADISRHDR